MWKTSREETPRVAPRRSQEPERVTNWLAGWVDYVFALTLMVSRWLRLPIVAPSSPQRLATADGISVPESGGPQWHHRVEKSPTSALVRIAEIGMVLVSFFLGAQLLSGTPTVAAPDLSKLTLTPDNHGIETRTVPSATAKQILVPAEQAVSVVPSTELVVAADVQESALLAPLPTDDAAAASLPAVTSVAEQPAAVSPSPEPTAIPEAAAAVAPPAPPAPAPTESSARANPALPDYYLTSDQIAAAALAAGWPPSLIPDVQKVAWCESRYHTHAQYLGARGLMQVLPFWFDVAGLDFSMWADPVTNLKAAKVAYDSHLSDFGDPWSAWTCKP